MLSLKYGTEAKDFSDIFKFTLIGVFIDFSSFNLLK